MKRCEDLMLWCISVLVSAMPKLNVTSRTAWSTYPGRWYLHEVRNDFLISDYGSLTPKAGGLIGQGSQAHTAIVTIKGGSTR